MNTPASSSCPMCGSKELAFVTERRQVTADDGTVLEYDDVLTHCQSCGFDHYTREQSLASSRARAGVLRSHEGLLTPEQIRSVRERLGYTQAQLELEMGVGPKTVVRWEKGAVRQSRLADNFIRRLAAFPHTMGGAQAIVTSQPMSAFMASGAAYSAWPNSTIMAQSFGGEPGRGIIFTAPTNYFANFVAGFATYKTQTDFFVSPVSGTAEMTFEVEETAANSNLAKAA